VRDSRKVKDETLQSSNVCYKAHLTKRVRMHTEKKQTGMTKFLRGGRLESN
jgi:hypothetical protein